MSIVTLDVGARLMFPKAVVMKLVQVVHFMDAQQINLDININKKSVMKKYLFLFIVFAGMFLLVSCGEDNEGVNNGLENNNGIENNNGNGNSGTVLPNLTGSINGHDYVDLGLSVKWATCNIGASSPELYGNYYAWGETLTRNSYYQNTYKFYNSNTEEVLHIGDNISGTQYDAATYYWGNKWRMPTKSELEELLTRCSWTWTTQSGIQGYNVVGKNGQSIFLPANGSYSGNDKGAKAGIFGEYWSGTFKTTTDFYSTSYALIFNQSTRKEVEGYNRYVGLAIRPVTTEFGDTEESSNNDNTGGSTTTYEKPDIGFYDFTATRTSLKVQYKIFNKEEANVTSAKIYYGTSSNTSSSVKATVSGVLITANISGLKTGTTYYVKCSATGKSGTTTTSTTKCITNY